MKKILLNKQEIQMMKKSFSLFFLLSLFVINAQNKRFVYEYKFIPNKDEPNDVKTEVMNLDVHTSGSRFYSYTMYNSDSLMKANLEKQLASTGMINIDSRMKKGLVKYSITKDYPQYNVYFNNQILTDRYKVKDERPIVWKISSEKEKIGAWEAQKAETDFAGRHWTAWFTSDIAIQDGPYKFHGLPGLIVKLEDDTKSHRFELKAINSINTIAEDIFKRNEISVSLKQYDKILKDYENDPTKGLKQLQAGSGVVMIMKDGANKDMKEQENRLKEKIKKDNNRIECSVF